jgi:hypothetical protein
MSFGKRSVPSARLDRIKRPTPTSPSAAKPVDARQRMAAKEAANAEQDAVDAHYMKMALIGVGALSLVAGAFALPSLFETKAIRVVIAPAEAANPVMGNLAKVTERMVYYVGSASNPNQISPMAKSVRDTCLPKATPHKPTLLESDTWTETGATATDSHPHAIRANFARGTEYLTCALKTEQKRFCDSHYKAQIVQHIRVYADTFARIVAKKQADIAFLEGMGQTRVGAHAAGSALAVQGMLDTIEGKDPTARWPQVPTFDAGVAESLRAVSRDGYISADDFISWRNRDTLPAAIAPYLLPATAKKC